MDLPEDSSGLMSTNKFFRRGRIMMTCHKNVAKLFAVSMLALALVATGCSEGTNDDQSQPDAQANADTVSAMLENLPDLGDDYIYEGWLIIDGSPVSAGRFESSGGQTEFEFEGDFDATPTAYVLTIEPREGDDPAPASTHILAGTFSDQAADLAIGHSAALGTDFANASGSYILQTPSSSEPSDYDQGIWYIDPAAGAASLSLPELPDGWAYEGWVVGDDGPITTGRFLAADMADEDAAGSAAGPEDTPPVPGQDFIDPAMSLIDYAVVISVEPQPDNSPAPFALKPLVDGNADDVGAGTLQSLELMTGAEPTGQAQIDF
jgi:hypothetical protein